jgi:hypothetical protein
MVKNKISPARPGIPEMSCWRNRFLEIPTSKRKRGKESRLANGWWRMASILSLPAEALMGRGLLMSFQVQRWK